MPVIVTGPLGPTDPILDEYPTHEAQYELGGPRVVDTITDRDAIPLLRRDWGMMVTVSADPTPTNNTVWMLCNIALGGVSDTLSDNTNWVDIGQGAGVLTVTDDGNGVVTVDNTDPDNPIIGFAGVNVDNITITGDGTALDPLVATASGTGLDEFALAVKVATTTVLPGSPTYNNGVAGVGATLTRGSNGTLGTIDGVSGFIVGDRILVKNQATQLENGVYEVTQVGGGGTPYILTRTTDSDQTAELDDQVVAPAQGTVGGGLTFGQQTASPTVGTSNIVYSSGSVFVRQKTSGTQVLGQVPWWTGVARQLDKGVPQFFWDSVNKRLGVGHNVPTSTVFIRSATNDSTTFPLFVQNSATSTMFAFRSDGAFTIGLNADTSLPNMVNVDTNINGVIGATGNYRIAINGSANGFYSTALGVGSNTNAAGAQALSPYSNATGVASLAVGMTMSATATGAVIIGSDYNAAITNAIARSFMIGLGGNTGVSHKQSFFVNYRTNVVLDSETTLVDGTNYDSHTTNTVTIHKSLTGTPMTVTSVTNNGGVAQFNFASNTTLLTGDQVITSGFGVYNNQTYWIAVTSGTSVHLHPTLADAMAGTNAVAFISTDTGTITPQGRKPAFNITDAFQLYSDESTAGQQSPHIRTEDGGIFIIGTGKVGWLTNNDLSLVANNILGIRLDANANINTPGLHNNATAFGDAANGEIRSGTYTPTLSNLTNLNSATIEDVDFQWSRIGNVVNVSGAIRVDVTNPSVLTKFDLTIPVPSAFGASSGYCGGTGNEVDPVNAVNKEGSMAIIANGNDNVTFSWFPDAPTANTTWAIHFTYLVV